MSKDLTGIYSITNKINNKIYVGSSKNIYKRWSQHRVQLKANRHANHYLQNSYNKYGLINFEFKILEKCEFERLFILERQYIEDLGTFDTQYGYNLSLPNTNNKPKIISEESRYKMAISTFKGTEEEYIKHKKGELVRYHGKLVSLKRKRELSQIKKDRQKIRVYQLTKKGEFIKIHSSIGDCAKYNNTTHKTIRTHLKTSGKYRYKQTLLLSEKEYHNEFNLIINYKKHTKIIFEDLISKYDLDKNLINTYSTVREAAQEIGSTKAQEKISRSILYGKEYHKHQYTRSKIVKISNRTYDYKYK